ncbi:MAG: hypothetical protein ACREP9_08555, partial [Candidatus Dormibacteraceae bacterium]
MSRNIYDFDDLRELNTNFGHYATSEEMLKADWPGRRRLRKESNNRTGRTRDWGGCPMIEARASRTAYM